MPFYYFKPTSGLNLQIKAGWATVHVWWKRIWLYSIDQANQNVVLSTASVSMLLQGGFRVCPSQKNFKNYMLCVESKGISNVFANEVILTLTVHILAIAMCSFIFISTSIATLLQLLTQMTHWAQIQ